MKTRHPWFVSGDLDGFFGLFVDNLLQLMLITVLCQYACGFPASFIAGRILPGVAMSILAGNLFYAWQARRLARSTGRMSVTALPFGINTISLLAFIFLVMAPVYHETGDSSLAWKVGLAACFISGLIETAGAFVGDWLRRNTPRAALLSGLGGVALSFMTLGFALQIFSAAPIALLPMMVILVLYSGRVRLPLRLPGGLIAIAAGTGLAWVLKWLGLADFSSVIPPAGLGFNVPKVALAELFSVFLHPAGWTYVAVVVPMGLFNIIGSIENLDSAEAAGDRFETRPALLANGLTSLMASALGSPFPTTIYMGHPGWKAMGARTGYSVLNGVAITALCLAGGVTALLCVVPLEVTLGIQIWIGLAIVEQAFHASPRRHAVAVVLGFIPTLAAWVLHIVETSLRAAGTNLYEAFDQFGSELYLHGILSLYQGFLLISIIFSAIMAHVIDRQFVKAAGWSFAAAALSAAGLIHAYNLTPAGVGSSFGWMAAPWYVGAYLALGILLLLMRNSEVLED